MTAEEAAADPTVEILSIDPEDAAFILGKGGSTKKKVARAAGVKLELDSSAMDAAAANNANGGDAGANSAPSPSHALYIKDKSEAKRRRAREYVGFVLQQRRGKIEVDFPSDGRAFCAAELFSKCPGVFFSQTVHAYELEKIAP